MLRALLQDRRGWIFIGVLALTWAPLLWTSLGQLNHRFIGMESVDGYGTLWYYWHVGTSLQAGESPFHTDLFFYPYGKDMFADSGGNILDAVLAWPLRAALGPVSGTNAFYLLGLMAAGVSFAVLARSLRAGPLAAACGGIWFSITPYALHELSWGRPTQGLLVLLPLFLLFALRVGRERNWKPVVGAGISLGALGYQYWYYLLFSALICLCLAAVRLAWPAAGAGSRREILLRYSGVAVIALVITLPAGLEILSAVNDALIVGLIDTSTWRPWEVPSNPTDWGKEGNLLLWQPLSATSDSALVPGMFSVGTIFLPWALIIGSLGWLIHIRSASSSEPTMEPRAWLAMVAVAVTLALGPVATLGSSVVPNPFYICLVKIFNVMERLWWPYRAGAWISMLFGLGLTLGIDGLIRRRPGLRASALIGTTVFLTVDIWMRGMLPLPSWSADPPAGYACLVEGAGEPIIQVPYQMDYAHLYYQTLHHRPMLGGMGEESVLVEPGPIKDLREQNTWLGAIYHLTATELPLMEWSPEDKATLKELGYRFLVVRLDALAPFEPAQREQRTRQIRQGLRELVGEPIYQDARIWIYAPWGTQLPCDEKQISKDVSPRVSHASHNAAGDLDTRGPRWLRP